MNGETTHGVYGLELDTRGGHERASTHEGESMRQAQPVISRITRRLWSLRYSGAVGLLFLLPAASAPAYSVLTHEAIIDSTWDSAIKPLLVKRFPAATADELTEAHAYAYVGCIIQERGDYPFR